MALKDSIMAIILDLIIVVVIEKKTCGPIMAVLSKSRHLMY